MTQIAKLEIRQYHLRAVSPNLMLTKVSRYTTFVTAIVLWTNWTEYKSDHSLVPLRPRHGYGDDEGNLHQCAAHDRHWRVDQLDVRRIHYKLVTYMCMWITLSSVRFELKMAVFVHHTLKRTF